MANSLTHGQGQGREAKGKGGWETSSPSLVASVGFPSLETRAHTPNSLSLSPPLCLIVIFMSSNDRAPPLAWANHNNHDFFSCALLPPPDRPPLHRRAAAPLLAGASPPPSGSSRRRTPSPTRSSPSRPWTPKRYLFFFFFFYQLLLVRYVRAFNLAGFTAGARSAAPAPTGARLRRNAIRPRLCHAPGRYISPSILFLAPRRPLLCMYVAVCSLEWSMVMARWSTPTSWWASFGYSRLPASMGSWSTAGGGMSRPTGRRSTIGPVTSDSSI